ncbi:OsmC family peroxiredoxin [Lipingzhangella sp. LS1_29]|uniref:OsmC family peroxiredoxin n=1 Tax=Lipingzhangella rawalii TaxID=2055835 RepID=A0ABU2H105_9ACTN|nr:OsmC family peroxiredoxin [Lipingzhangella rawalii]MDS1268976.1 OsmC family peroxiredoxin [Lipingzhangella rawalii]
MAAVRSAHAQWQGDLATGGGTVTVDSSALPETEVTWKARAEGSDSVTSPEELIAAAHSSCMSMALTNGLTKAGYQPTSVRVTAEVSFQAGEGITGSHLTVRAQVTDISAADFTSAAEEAKANCPVSKALTGTTITLDATLE